MEQENKRLLLNSLCARLPYGVKVDIPDLFVSTKTNVEVLNEIFCGDDGEFRCNSSGILIRYVKPYLFPLSSMTEDQRELRDEILDSYNSMEHCYIKLIDWYNQNHFDYMNLIPKGLAIDCTNLNIY